MGVNLGQGQDIFSNPFKFLSKNKQVAVVQQDSSISSINELNTHAEETHKQTINKSSAIQPESANKAVDDGVLNKFMGNFE